MKLFTRLILLAFLLITLFVTGCLSDNAEEYTADQELTDAEITETDFETAYDFSSFDFESYYDQVDHLIIAYFEIFTDGYDDFLGAIEEIEGDHPEWSEFYYEYGVLYEGDEHLYEEYDALLQDYLEAFYEKYADRFVSDYAATSPAEDLAESFMVFVLQDKPEGNLIRDQKVRFFYDFPEMVAVRDHARQYPKSIAWL